MTKEARIYNKAKIASVVPFSSCLQSFPASGSFPMSQFFASGGQSTVRMAIIKQSTNNKYQRGCGEKGILLYYWWECKFIQPLWRTIWRILKKLGIKTPYDPAIPLLGIYPEEIKILKDTWTPVFTAALFTIAGTWKQPRCPSTDEWIKKLWYIFKMEYHSAIIKEHI